MNKAELISAMAAESGLSKTAFKESIGCIYRISH